MRTAPSFRLDLEGWTPLKQEALQTASCFGNQLPPRLLKQDHSPQPWKSSSRSRCWGLSVDHQWKLQRDVVDLVCPCNSHSGGTNLGRANEKAHAMPPPLLKEFWVQIVPQDLVSTANPGTNGWSQGRVVHAPGFESSGSASSRSSPCCHSWRLQDTQQLHARNQCCC